MHQILFRIIPVVAVLLLFPASLAIAQKKAKKQKIETFQIQCQQIFREFSISPNGKFLVSLSEKRENILVDVWDLEKKKLEQSIEVEAYESETSTEKDPIPYDPSFSKFPYSALKILQHDWLDDRNLLIEVYKDHYYVINLSTSEYWPLYLYVKRSSSIYSQTDRRVYQLRATYQKDLNIFYDKSGRTYHFKESWNHLVPFKTFSGAFPTQCRILSSTEDQKYMVVYRQYPLSSIFEGERRLGIYRYDVLDFLRSFDASKLLGVDPLKSHYRDPYFVPGKAVIMFLHNQREIVFWDFVENKVVRIFPTEAERKATIKFFSFDRMKISSQESVYAVNYRNRPIEVRTIMENTLLFKGPFIFEARNYCLGANPLKLAVSPNHGKIVVYYLSKK
ncbi:Hypothetical protein PBC10988_8010 [Planctomycetales bacterium 10988]|nr:Hypothetical protein PBC10988_8010 [Planctomycetales bacterium 10988]